ncbi:MAG: hypothetical protein SGILL_006186 [Bacillariaceae sp.]
MASSLAPELQRTLRRIGTGRRLPAFSRTPVSAPSIRLLSSSHNPPVDLQHIQQHYKIHRRGQDGHGSREYLLLPPEVKNVEQVQLDSTLPAAAIFAHRNILFGARSFLKDVSVTDVCPPLVQRAVQEAEEYGEQPQGMASLQGLCAWVAHALQEPSTTSPTLQKLDDATLEAVRAIATQVPRPGHSVVGQGTYRDGKDAWQALAKEYIELQLGDEANLYMQHGGRLVAIEHMADTSPDYLKSAGGAMARFFFL